MVVLFLFLDANLIECTNHGMRGSDTLSIFAREEIFEHDTSCKDSGALVNAPSVLGLVEGVGLVEQP